MMSSTEGPLEVVTTHCARRHVFTLPAQALSDDVFVAPVPDPLTPSRLASPQAVVAAAPATSPRTGWVTPPTSQALRFGTGRWS